MIPNFNVENLRRDKKPQAYNQSKTSTMKKKKKTKYKVLPSSSLPILVEQLD